jgi:hypothetical protein
VLQRWNRNIPPVLGVVFAALSVWSLVDGDYGEGALQLAFSAFWLVMAFWGRRRAVLGGRRTEG